MIRPEQVVLNSEPLTMSVCWRGRVIQVGYRGADALAEVTCENGVTVRVRTHPGVSVEQCVTVGFNREDVWVIPETDNPIVTEHGMGP
jgi:putative spermidine/putrescine transport system ATP-binding protein